MKIGVLFVSLLFAGICNLSEASYDGYKVYSVSPTSIGQLDILKELEYELNLDFWDHLVRGDIDRTHRILVEPQNLEKLENKMNQHNIEYTILIDDVTKMMKDEYSRNTQAKKDGRNVDGVDFSYFWKHEDILEYLEEIAEKYQDLVKLEYLGKTHLQNEIVAVKISKTGVVDDTRPIIIVEGTIHAREWITPMVCMHLISELVENSEEHNDILEGLDWIIVPVMNVDGYKFTHENTENRFWRKNLSPALDELNPTCIGVDLNRNFAYNWDRKVGTSPNQCGYTYPGETAASELETQIISELILKYKKTVLFLDVHSHGKYLLYPWAYDYILADNYLELNELGTRVTKAIYDVNKTVYSMGNTAFTLYPCSGVTTDFAAGEAKIPLAWTIELPGGGTLGFDIEPEKIQSVLDETLPGLRQLALFVQERYVK